MSDSLFRRRPGVVVAVGVFFTSISSILIRLSDAPALTIAAYRLTFATLLVAPLYLHEALSRRDAEPEPTGGRDAPGRVRAILLSVVSGAFLAAHFGLWISSLEYTTVASSTVIVSMSPILVAVAASVFLGDRITVRGVLAIVGAIAGSVVLAAGGLGQGEAQSLGNLLAFFGAVAVSGYIIAGRVVRRRFTVNAYTLIVYSVAAVLLVATALVLGAPLGPWPVREFLIFAALALFCTLLGHSLYSWALRYVRPAIISTSTLGEPVFASTLALIVLGEVPSLTTIGGGLIILVSIYAFIRLETDAASKAGLPPGGAAP